VIPSVFDRRVAPVVAEAVARAAEASGVARKTGASALA
jgi:malic enzyme